MSELPPSDPVPERRRRGLWSRLKRWFLAGLIVLGPTAITLYVSVRILWALDSLLGRYITIPALDTPLLPEGRVPGLGIVAILVLILVAGALASALAGSGALAAWERVLTRFPPARILYTATKGMGEALLSGRRTAFRQVVLAEYPRPGVWVLAFRSADPPVELSMAAGVRLVAVFVPNTPNPTSGYFRLLPETSIRPVALTVEQAVKLIASAGIVQTPASADADAPDSPAAPEVPVRHGADPL